MIANPTRLILQICQQAAVTSRRLICSRQRTAGLSVAFLLGALTLSLTPTMGYGQAKLLNGEELSRLQAALTSPDAPIRQQAVQRLRSRGPAGLEVALHLLTAARIDAPTAPTQPASGGTSSTTCRRSQLSAVAPTALPASPAGYTAAEWELLKKSLDEISGQYIGHVSQLYWYTDRAKAQAAARTLGRPLLHLRMLGKLTEPLSCANSRFFRTVLYCDPVIAADLRQHYVLVWESVREVPVMTVEFGDGRQLRRTITGNSAHYVTLPDGTIVDGLPGLHTPQAFRNWLETCQLLVSQLTTPPQQKRGGYSHQLPVAAQLSHWHSAAATELQTRFAEALQAQQQPAAVPFTVAPAHIANRRAMAKSAVETPLLDGFVQADDVSPAPTTNTAGAYLTINEQMDWRQLAHAQLNDLQLSDATIQLIAQDLSLSETTLSETTLSETPLSGAPVEPVVSSESLQPTLENFKLALLADALRNELDLHRQLHAWLASGEPQPADLATNLEALNQRVYAELFAMNLNDPWLGLKPDHVYTGLSQAVAEGTK